jgi:hypothetical protein
MNDIEIDKPDVERFTVRLEFEDKTHHVYQASAMALVDGVAIEVIHGEDGDVVIVPLSRLRFVSTSSHPTVNAEGNVQESCNKAGPRVGDEVARCTEALGHDEKVWHFDSRRGAKW